MLPSTKRHELLAYGPRGGRAVAKTAAEMAAAVNAGRVHNRLAGYVGQPHDALEPRHVKGALTLMLVAGELPAAATLHLLFPDGEPRYAIVVDAFLPRTDATFATGVSSPTPARSSVTTPATSRKPLLNLLQTPPPIPSPLKSLLVARELGSPPSPALLEIVDDAISTSEKSQNELLRLQELTVRTEGQLSRLGALLTSASSSLAFAVEESYGLAARFEEVKSSSQAAVMDFGKFVAETCSLMLIRAPAAETCASSVPLVVSTLMEDIGNLSSQLAASGGPSTVAEVDEMISQLADSAAQLSLSLEQTREFHDVLLALDDIKADTEDASAVAGALELGSRLVAAMPKTLELLQEHKALQVHTQQQQLAIERLRDMNSNLRERVVDLNAESSASAAELEEAIQLAFTQKLALEEMSSLLAGAPEAGDPVGDAERRADAALRALSSALRAVR